MCAGESGRVIEKEREKEREDEEVEKKEKKWIEVMTMCDRKSDRKK